MPRIMQYQPIPNSTANERDRSRYSTDFGCSSDHFEHGSTISRNQPILKTWHPGGVDVWRSDFSMTRTSSKTRLVNYFLYWLLFVLANIYYILPILVILSWNFSAALVVYTFYQYWQEIFRLSIGNNYNV